MMHSATTALSMLVNINADSATLLLHRYSWSLNQVSERWYEDESAARCEAGIAADACAQPQDIETRVCGICLDMLTSPLSAGCGAHDFCAPCWRGYALSALHDGSASALALRCPQPGCRVAAPPSLTRQLLLEEGGESAMLRLDALAIRAFVEARGARTLRWCPGLDCSAAIERLRTGDAEARCASCDTTFCFDCGCLAHRPLSCALLKAWEAKTRDEGPNAEWVVLCVDARCALPSALTPGRSHPFSHTKPCPKCRRPVEKSAGCMHMTWCVLYEAPSLPAKPRHGCDSRHHQRVVRGWHRHPGFVQCRASLTPGGRSCSSVWATAATNGAGCAAGRGLLTSKPPVRSLRSRRYSSAALTFGRRILLLQPF